MPFTLTGGDVRHLRDIAGVTQADLARHLGYSRQAICNWERRTDRSIPRTQYDRVLTFLRSRYDVATGQRRQARELTSQKSGRLA